MAGEVAALPGVTQNHVTSSSSTSASALYPSVMRTE